MGEGKRFANELGRRDYVTGEMWKNKPPFRLCLNKAASDEIIWHCKHYTGRGVMKYYASGEELAKDMGVPLSVLEAAHDQHYQAAKKTEKDPDGGSWPAYPSGKSWDDASGPTGSGKKFYHNIIPGSAVKTEPFYVAIITPVIHYCMGGLEVDVDSAVLARRPAKPSRACTPRARWLVASTATIAWVGILCWTASFSAASPPRPHASTRSARTASTASARSR